MKHNSIYVKNSDHPLPMIPALRDGLIIMAGLLVATGGFFNSEIAMWWLVA